MAHVRKRIYPLLSVVLFFAVWQFAVMFGLLPNVLIPSPIQCFVRLWEGFRSGEVFYNMSYSLTNVAAGLGLAIVVGVPAGLLIGTYYGRVADVLLPFCRMCEKLNMFALFPVFMTLFGVGHAEKIAVVFWVSQWPILFHTIDGVREIDRYPVKMARSLGASDRKVFFSVIFPSTLPNIFTGLKLGAQVSFFMIIASEMIGVYRGLGYLFAQSNMGFKLPYMFGIILLITAIAVLIHVLFTALEKHFLVWKQSAF